MFQLIVTFPVPEPKWLQLQTHLKYQMYTCKTRDKTPGKEMHLHFHPFLDNWPPIASSNKYILSQSPTESAVFISQAGNMLFFQLSQFFREQIGHVSLRVMLAVMEWWHVLTFMPLQPQQNQWATPMPSWCIPLLTSLVWSFQGYLTPKLQHMYLVLSLQLIV